MALFAKCTPAGTAANETCLCGECLEKHKYDSCIQSDDPTLGDYQDCTDNEYLECQICGSK